MKSIKKTVYANSLETGNELKIDVSIEDENGLTNYPQEIVILNSTGATVGILYIQSDEEDELRPEYSGFFDFIPLDTGRSVGVLPANTKYLIFKKLSGTATQPLDFYCLGYDTIG